MIIDALKGGSLTGRRIVDPITGRGGPRIGAPRSNGGGSPRIGAAVMPMAPPPFIGTWGRGKKKKGKKA